MCDTFVVLPDATAEHCVVFAKNSDRQRNEAQSVEHYGPEDHSPESAVTCTYISIPQVRHTHAILLCRPFWIWGAEMGANEHGVVIGNEALRARTPAPEIPALTGMDLVRLGLERAVSAAEALEVIVHLLEQYGQGGDCGHMVPLYYNNAFLIADSREAFVLESIGREWLVERVERVRAISNCYSIGEKPDRVSAGLSLLLEEFGWKDSNAPIHRDIIGDRQRDAPARARLARSNFLLNACDGELATAQCMRVLRDHGPSTVPGWCPRDAAEPVICMHATHGERAWQTTNSMISEIRPHDSVHWVTGTAAPCISIFKPMMVDVPTMGVTNRLNGCWDPNSLWWRHELLHRTVIHGDFVAFLEDIEQERDALEAEFRNRMRAVEGASHLERVRVVRQCWRDASQMEDRWLSRKRWGEVEEGTPFHAAWLKMNRVAGVPNIVSAKKLSPT